MLFLWVFFFFLKIGCFCGEFEYAGCSSVLVCLNQSLSIGSNVQLHSLSCDYLNKWLLLLHVCICEILLLFLFC